MSKPKAAQPPKPDPTCLQVQATPDESEADALARTLLRPSVNAAQTLRGFGKKYGDSLAINSLVTALSEQAGAAEQGDLKRAEGMLMIQAHTLDSIFNELGQRAAMNMGEHLPACELYLRLALKAQAQCRATLETLAELKNPHPVAFVRQANIATGPQQINNGTIQGAPGSRADICDNPPSKLLEADDGERLDTRTTIPASAANQAMEPVGAIDRTTDPGG